MARSAHFSEVRRGGEAGPGRMETQARADAEKGRGEVGRGTGEAGRGLGGPGRGLGPVRRRHSRAGGGSESGWGRHGGGPWPWFLFEG